MGRFESALYFASQERFKSQLFSLVMNPSTHSEKDAPANVTSEISITPDSPNDCNSIPANGSTNGFAVASTRKEDASAVIHHLLLDCSAMTYIDVSGLDMLQLVVTRFERAGVEVWLTDVPPATLGTLARSGFLQKLGNDKVFYTVFDGLERLRWAESVVARL